jgi:hypothetical protein
MTVSQTLKNNIKKFRKPQYSWAFFGTLIAGLVAHLPAMTHNLPTYDTFWNIYSNQDMITSGRQFLTFACGGSSFYNLPWVNGLLALLYLGLTAIVITELFEIKKPFLAALAGAVLGTFPAVTGTFVFIYTIDGYMLALFLSCLAVLLALKVKWGFIPALFLLGFAVGVYQSYFSVAALLCLFILIRQIINAPGEWKKFFGRAWRFMVVGIGGYVFYVVSLKVMLSLSGKALSGYQGTDRVGKIALDQLPAGIVQALRDFKDFSLPNGAMGENIYMKLSYTVFALLCFILLVYLIVKNKVFRKIPDLLVLIVLFAFVPLFASMICIMAPEALFHILMRMPWAILFCFGLSLFSEEAMEKLREKTIGKIWHIAACLSLLILVFNFILSANIVYFNLNERYEKTYGLCVRIVDRLEQTEGYKQTDAVAILGGFPNAEKYPSTEITRLITAGYHSTQGDYCVESSEKYAEFLKHYLNVTITVPPLEDQINLTTTEEFMEMPYFPEDGSIRNIHGVWVIKLNG